jgi:hypothetical protein
MMHATFANARHEDVRKLAATGVTLGHSTDLSEPGSVARVLCYNRACILYYVVVGRVVSFGVLY